jgi:hypothetical protein
MMKAVLPIVLGFAASAAIACPGADKAMDAKANAAPTVASALSAVTQQSKAEVDKKVVKTVDAKKPSS